MDEGARRFGGIARLFVGLALACVGSSAAYVATTQQPSMAIEDTAASSPQVPAFPALLGEPTGRCGDIQNLVDVHVPPDVMCHTVASMLLSEGDVQCALATNVPPQVRACLADKLRAANDPSSSSGPSGTTACACRT